MDKKIFHRKEIAEYLGVSPMTVDRWGLPCVKVGRLKLFRLDEVLEFLEEKKVGGGSNGGE